MTFSYYRCCDLSWYKCNSLSDASRSTVAVPLLTFLFIFHWLFPSVSLLTVFSAWTWEFASWGGVMCVHQPLFFPSDLVDWVAQNSLIFFHWWGMFIFLPSQFIHCCDGDQENTAETTLPWLLGRFCFLFMGSTPEPPRKQLGYSAEKVMWRAQGAQASWGFPPLFQGIEPVEMGHLEPCRPAHPPVKYLSDSSGYHVEQKNCIPEPSVNSWPPNCEI